MQNFSFAGAEFMEEIISGYLSLKGDDGHHW
ncbi:unnamed protein product [Victoria cruziana]